jgi:hypothetical protein
MTRNIGGLWNIVQTNATCAVAVTPGMGPDGAFTLEGEQLGSNVHGYGAGHIANNMVSFVINWDNNTAGAYNGAFDDGGTINGSTFDLKNPGSFAGWHSSKAFTA